MSVNDATNVAAAAALSTSSAVAKSVAKTFTNNIIAKTLQHLTRKRYKCYFGKSFDQLPNDELSELSPEILACYSGPDNGISDVSLISHRRLLQKQSTVVQNSTPNAIMNRRLSDATKTEAINKVQGANRIELTNQHNNNHTVQNGHTDIPQINVENNFTDRSKSKNPIQENESNNGPKPTQVKVESMKNGNCNGTSENSIKPNGNIDTKHTSIQVESKEPGANQDTTQSVNKPTPNKITEQTLINECWDSFSRSRILKWNIHHRNTYGIACSLYENNLITKTTVGDPIADVFSVLTRQNSSIMILADGVNWGPRSRLAARSAVRASMNYLNKHMFFPSTTTDDLGLDLDGTHKLNTHGIFALMMRSFDVAQEYILQKKGTMTTLCVSVVLKLKESASTSTPLWAVCTLSVGDSTAYVFNKEKGVLELTYGARNINDDRDMRNVGGALGHVYGRKPDVSNLNYSFMYIKEGDIVFLVSDGISDNFDPCVSQTAIRKPELDKTSPSELSGSLEKLSTTNNQPNGQIHRNSLISFASTALNYSKKGTSQANLSRTNQRKNTIALATDDQKVATSTLPQLSPTERYLCGLAHMNEVIHKRKKKATDKITAHEMCTTLVDHVLKVTAIKRNLLEKGLTEAANLNEEERKKFQASLREKALKLRGKLDHASIVAYEVGICTKL